MPANRTVVKVVLVLGFFLALLIRIEPTFLGKTHFSIDQALDAGLVKRLVVNHDVSLISRYTGLEGVFMGPWYTWLMAPVHLISGGNPSADVWFLSLLSLTASLGFGYWVYRRFGKISALLAMVLIWFSPAFITASQVVYSPAPLVPLMLGILVVWYETMIRHRFQLMPLLVGLVSMTTQFEAGFAAFFIPSLLVASLVVFRPRLRLRPKLAFLSLVAFLIPLLPQLGFEIRNNWLMTRSVMTVLGGESSSLGSQNLGILARVASRANSLFQDVAYTVSVPELGWWLAALVFVVLIATGLSSNNKHRQFFLAVVVLMLGMYLGFSLYGGPVWGWYRAGIPPFLVVMAALAIPALIHRFDSKWLVPALVAWWILWGVNPFERVNSWSQPADSVSAVSVQHQALDAVYSKANGEPFALYVYTPPVYPYIWDYQLYWYARSRFGYLPSPYDIMPQAPNPDLVFLLIEPDYENPARIDGWLGNFKAHGYQLESWPLPANITLLSWKFESTPSNPLPLTRFVDILDEE